MIFGVLFLFYIFSLVSSRKPLIGVVSLPTHDSDHTKHSYIAASYVKWIESGGGIAVPLLFDDSEKNLQRLFEKINGILFTGGSADLNFGNKYFDTLKFLYDKAVNANKNGDYFPIWGTCLGFQSLMVLASNNASILSDYKGVENASLPISFNANSSSTSRLFSSFPPEVIHTYENEGVTLNSHHWGVSPQDFVYNGLDVEYSLIATNVDTEDKAFVSAVESLDMPFYATQWHPEKPQFESFPTTLNTGFNSLVANSLTQVFFISESAKNKPASVAESELSRLPPSEWINAYTPTFNCLNSATSYFQETYFFHKVKVTGVVDWSKMIIFFSVLAVLVIIIAFLFIVGYVYYILKKKFVRKGTYVDLDGENVRE